MRCLKMIVFSDIRSLRIRGWSPTEQRKEQHLIALSKHDYNGHIHILLPKTLEHIWSQSHNKSTPIQVDCSDFQILRNWNIIHIHKFKTLSGIYCKWITKFTLILNTLISILSIFSDVTLTSMRKDKSTLSKEKYINL